jgi:hypothetical protein
MAEAPKLHAEDVMPVRSRVSWGAILAGAMVALAVFYLLSLLGVAVGISMTGTNWEDRLGVGAVVWATLTTLIALFLGGWVASQLAVGENKLEAAIYGVILWGTVFTALLALVVNGVNLGFTGIVALGSNPHLTETAERNVQGTTPEAKRATVEEKAEQYRREIRREATSSQATQGAWWAFGGILLSMIAAVGGAVAGAGPTMVLQRVFVRQPVPANRV